MGPIREVKVPDIGDFEGVDVIEVLVAPGDPVRPEDSLITLESDKATMDVPSPLAGTVKELKVEVGSTVSEGDVILLLEAAEQEEEQAEEETAAGKPDEAGGEGALETEAAAIDGEAPEPHREKAEKTPEERRAPAAAPGVTAAPRIDDEAFRTAHASPGVRRFARELGVDLSKVEGSGRKGRITKDDVRRHVKAWMAEPERPAAAGLALPEMPEIDFSRFGEIERVELSRIQKIGAKNLHRSWLHVPHVTQHDEADVTELEEFRKSQQPGAEGRGVKLTVLAFLMKAAVRALEEYPAFNSSLDPDGEHLILKRYFHLGIAVDTEGGLVVPVIRDVGRKGLLELAGELGEVSARAREGKLKLDELQGASFTISSLGGIGGTAFTPIVNAPEVAILGVSRMGWKPVLRDGEWVPRLMLPLSLSYDHRVIDGAAAARFTTFVGRVLGDLRLLLL